MVLSRWAKSVDKSDARFLLGMGLIGGGLAWAIAPAWGAVAVGALIVAPNVVEWVSALVSRQEGGED